MYEGTMHVLHYNILTDWRLQYCLLHKKGPMTYQTKTIKGTITPKR